MAGRFVRLVQSFLWGVVLLAVFGASAYLSFNLFVRRGAMTVPELAGLTSEEASRLLSDQGLRFRAAEPAGRWSAVVDEGRVIESRPRAGGYVKRGSAVEVVLSLGLRRASVPNLAGKAVSAAQVTVQAEGLEVGDTLILANGAGEPGTIVGQDPPPGASVPAGTRIDLLVARDGTADTFVMPDLVYRRYEPVRGFFEGGGFRMGAVKFEPYEGISDGTILRQNPLPGHPLRRRDVISLVVAASQGALP
ncbi:MAG: PASTA domain-containing protein [Thermoanaerobaculia bacterium]